MKTISVLLLLSTGLQAHTWKVSDDPVEREALRAHVLEEWRRDHAGVASTASVLQIAAAAVANAANAPATAKAFLPFTKLDLRADGDFLYVGSNGLPDHNMMVGITAWQQQVPLPQLYYDDNAWRIPLKPVPATKPAMIKGRFLRGAIALAVNGIPIFNPQNNRGEVSYEIGELDQWGGHCGRADDYHYHITPLHLQTQAGKGMPVAYVLDGYPIYGLTEPDGSPLGKLDECHGHDDAKLGYHYHASMKYPYVIGGFHGEVVERGEQVDPQPRAQGVREALPALRGAEITGFESTGKTSYKLSYTVNGDKRNVAYSINADGTYPFEFDNGRDGKTKEVYSARKGGGGGGPPRDGPEGMKGKGQGKGKSKGGGMRSGDQPSPHPQAFEGTLDVNADGIVTAQEFAENTKSQAMKQGVNVTQALGKARTAFLEMDRDRSGQLEDGEWQNGTAPPSSAVAMNRGGNEPPAGGPGMKPGSEAGGGGGRGGQAFVERPDQPRSSDGKFLLASPAMEDKATMPAEYTGDGEAATLPLDFYVNDRLITVDSIQFTPHNVVSVDFLPEYPMTIAVLAKDNADPKTGLDTKPDLDVTGAPLR